MEALVGIFMLVCLFGGLFFFGVKHIGWKETIFSFATCALIVVWVSLAVYFLTGDLSW